MTWAQPQFYVHEMIRAVAADADYPSVLHSAVAPGAAAVNVYAAKALEKDPTKHSAVALEKAATATAESAAAGSGSGGGVVVRAVNPNAASVQAVIELVGFSPAAPFSTVSVTQLHSDRWVY
jgi:hypothetical protein